MFLAIQCIFCTFPSEKVLYCYINIDNLSFFQIGKKLMGNVAMRSTGNTLDNSCECPVKYSLNSDHFTMHKKVGTFLRVLVWSPLVLIVNLKL